MWMANQKRRSGLIRFITPDEANPPTSAGAETAQAAAFGGGDGHRV
jgi:hypothetical protein